MIYLDSSAAVKLYVAESGSTELIAALRADPIAATVRVTFAEVGAALAAGARLGRIADVGSVMIAFRGDWTGLVVVDVDQPLVDAAAGLAARYALRGYDAVQLAAARVVADGNPSAVGFACFDAALAAAAAHEGFRSVL